jgi:two-component system phosphate regulon response regulator PhoB
MRLKKESMHSKIKTTLQKGAIHIDVASLKASITTVGATAQLSLTGKEFKILTLLMQNEDKIFSRMELVKSVWGDDVHILERTVDSHIFGLRKKLGACADYIESIPNAGYRFSTPQK